MAIKHFVISVIMAAICTQTGFSQSTDDIPDFQLEENKIIYSDVISAPSLSSDALFGNAEQWYKVNFETNDNTLTTNNITDGKLSGTGIIHNNPKSQKAEPGDIFFTIDIHVEKGQYQYKVRGIYGFDRNGKFYYSDVNTEEKYPPAKPKWPETIRQSMLSNMNDKIVAMLEELKKEMIVPKPTK